MFAKRIAAPARHFCNRKSRGSGRDNRVVAAVPVDQLQVVALERQLLSQRLENQVGLGDRAREVVIIGPDLHPLRDRLRASRILCGLEAALGFVTFAGQHHNAESRPCKDFARASTHRPIGAEYHYSLDSVCQSKMSSLPKIRRSARSRVSRPGTRSEPARGPLNPQSRNCCGWSLAPMSASA